jgi:hypothetical protein
MIRKHANGSYYCDGKGCGYELSWLDGDPEDCGSDGLWSCPDCGAAVYAEKPRLIGSPVSPLNDGTGRVYDVSLDAIRSERKL